MIVIKGRVEKFIEIDDTIKEKLQEYPKYLTDYYNYLTSEAKSATTKRTYFNILLNFVKYFGRSIGKSQFMVTTQDLSELKITDIYGYITFKKECGDRKSISGGTLNLTLSVIESFSTFLYSCGITSKMVIDKKIKRARTENVSNIQVTFLEKEEIQTVQDSISNGVGNSSSIKKQEKWRNRDRLLFNIPIMTGIRVDALSNINLEDLFLESNMFIATDKGNKTKEYYIDDDTKFTILEWLSDRERIMAGASPSSALFISNRRVRISTPSIRAIVSKFTCDVNKNITPHKLRSTCGTMLYKNSNDIYLVAETLGHSSTVPTKRYTSISNERKRDAAIIMSTVLKK